MLFAAFVFSLPSFPTVHATILSLNTTLHRGQLLQLTCLVLKGSLTIPNLCSLKMSSPIKLSLRLCLPCVIPQIAHGPARLALGWPSSIPPRASLQPCAIKAAFMTTGVLESALQTTDPGYLHLQSLLAEHGLPCSFAYRFHPAIASSDWDNPGNTQSSFQRSKRYHSLSILRTGWERERRTLTQG